MPTQDELHRLRQDYGQRSLDEADVAPDPIEQFGRWFEDAKAAGLQEPNAMTLATVDADGQPSARILLLKDVDERGFTFFTNYRSRKGHDLDANPRVALLFFWPPLERQVRIEGVAARIPRDETDHYFFKRPRSAQVGAWSSHQSEVIASREVINTRERDIHLRFDGIEIPTPPDWGGYRVTPASVEFWQGRPSRLHDRLRYRKIESIWIVERLSP